MLAAARSLTVELTRAGLDWQAVAHAVQAILPTHAGGRAAKTPFEAACWLADQPIGTLSPRERAFVVAIRDELNRFSHDTHPQADWLDRLFRRAGGVWADDLKGAKRK